MRRLLESAPAVIPFIRHLRLYEWSWGNTPPLYVGFTSIRSLTVTGLRAYWLDVDLLLAFFCNFSAAVDVRLDDVAFYGVTQLVRLICAFPSLQRLAVTCDPVCSDKFRMGLPAPTAICLSPHLRVLELDNICMDAVLDWFLSLPDRPPLRAVGLRPLRTNNSSTIAKFLLALEDSLESFFIRTAITDGMYIVSLNLIRG
jgi:hypothetical protein